MKTLSFNVSGMSCGGCTSSVQKALNQIDGISRAEVTLRPGVATVDSDPERITSAQIEAAITRLGYPATARTPTA